MANTENMTSIKDAFSQIHTQIKAINPDARILAVSKKQSVSKIREAYDCGQRHFGENYLQEALPKIADLGALTDIQWHFIGPIQSNKCKAIAEHFDWIQSLDRLEIAEKLNRHCPESKALQVCVQVNLDKEAQKAGIAFEEIETFCKALQQYKHLTLRGLMLIPKAEQKDETLLAGFMKMASCFKNLKKHYPEMDTLSMGMSQDYILALETGATMVRIGSALFGERQ